MMRTGDMIVSALDIISIFTVLFLVLFLAIKYDASKGVGNLDYIKVIRHQESNIENQDNNNKKYFTFIAILIEEKMIKFYHYRNGKRQLIGQFNNVDQVEKSNLIDSKNIYFLYENKKTKYLEDIIRLFVSKGITVNIAHIIR